MSGFAGDNSALATVQNSLLRTTVLTAATPTFATNNTNMTIVGWIYPLAAVEGNGTGIFFSRSGYSNSTAGCGLQVAGSSGNTLGYHWDGDSAAAYNYNGGPVLPASNWCMVAIVVTPQSNMLYVGVTNVMYTSTEFMTNATGTTNINETWAGAWRLAVIRSIATLGATSTVICRRLPCLRPI